MTLSVTVSFEDVIDPSSVFYDGRRLMHQNEGGVFNDELTDGMPEIYPSSWQNGIPFTKDMQLMSWELMSRLNPSVTKKQWHKVFDERIAFTNYQSWNDATGKKRADFVNGLDTDAELPKKMKVTLCGGSFYGGYAVGDRLWMYPGIHGIDANKPIPSIDTIIKNNWYFHAITWHDTKDGNKVYDFPQGNGGIVAILLVLSVPVSYPLAWFEPWKGNELPNHLMYYR